MTNWHGIFVAFLFGTAFANHKATAAKPTLLPPVLNGSPFNNNKN